MNDTVFVHNIVDKLRLGVNRVVGWSKEIPFTPTGFRKDGTYHRQACGKKKPRCSLRNNIGGRGGFHKWAHRTSATCGKEL